MKNIILLIYLTFSSLIVKSQSAITINPNVGSSNCNAIKITRVEVSKISTKIDFTVINQYDTKGTFNISSLAVMSDFNMKELDIIRDVDFRFKIPFYPYGSQNQVYYDLWLATVIETRNQFLSAREELKEVVVKSAEGIDFYKNYNYKRSSKPGQNSFSLFFNPLPPGVKTISIIDLAENGIEFSGISINNPDNLEDTGMTKADLVDKWTANDAEDFEGFYEVVAANENQKFFEFALVKSDNGKYNLIYLNGFSHNGWRKGSIKGYLSPTSSPNIYQCDYFLFDKTMVSAMLSFNSAGLTMDLGDGEILKSLRTYPTKMNFSGNSGSEKGEVKNEIISSGTGFAISSNGYIATNYHVVEGANSISIRGVNGDFTKSYLADIAVTDKNNDIALLKIKEPGLIISNIPYQIYNQQIDVASTVFALGYPLIATMGDEIKYTNGAISSRSGFQGDLTMYQTSVPVQPGNSGGPLISSKGNIVGIITAKHSEAENASYAIKSGYLLNLIENVEPKIMLPTTNTISTKGVSEQIKAVKNFVYIIEIR